MIQFKSATVPDSISSARRELTVVKNQDVNKPVVLFMTSFPPRECGIATYSNDLISALSEKFNQSFTINICALENDHEHHSYPENVKLILNTNQSDDYLKLINKVNENSSISLVVIQHEFGFFSNNESDFMNLLKSINVPLVIGFHTVIPNPDEHLKATVQQISSFASAIIVMTKSSSGILVKDYNINKSNIEVISHGTHLVLHADKQLLKNKYQLTDKTVLSTFGLLSSGKSIETTLEALPAIISDHPEVVFLIIGKTHPSVLKHEGEHYRNSLETIVKELQLDDHVKFINYFIPLSELLEYLQLTDIYLFTSKDPNQAVSGTFSYAISCGCPVISTPIPHAREVLQNDTGIIFDFGNSEQLADAVIKLLNNNQLRSNISYNGMHRMASTAWENSAIAHTLLFNKLSDKSLNIQYNLPEVKLDHIQKMTTDFGMIQFAVINQPDLTSGYTLDDNARALVAMCQHFELTIDEKDIKYIRIYLDFIKFCQQPQGYFLNYVDENKNFSDQNQSTNIADSTGRAVWALGYLISMGALLPKEFVKEAESILNMVLNNITKIYSTRAMAFAIKGLYYAQSASKSNIYHPTITELANRLVQMYRHEADSEWKWFESYLTYANGIVPDAMLCAWKATGDTIYKEIAQKSFDFLLTKTFKDNSISVISNQTWLNKGSDSETIEKGGQQPIDVAYTILALHNFYVVFQNTEYLNKLKSSFDWFLGKNALNQIIYNPRTGGCYDGLETQNVNLNQGAESTVSYHMARLTLEKLYSDESYTRKTMRLSTTLAP